MFTIATIVPTDGWAVFDGWLRQSLERIQSTGLVSQVVIGFGNRATNIAHKYNKVLEAANGPVIFTHHDVRFTEQFLKRALEELGKSDVAVVGAVGRTERAIEPCLGLIEPLDVLTVDCALFAVNANQGFRFDDVTFDSFHLYAEDYCCQVRQDKRRVVVVPLEVGHFKHLSSTVKKDGFSWGTYKLYRKRLEDKWAHLLPVKTC